ncbi:LacI family DNA-binding transcriptional regulator [Nakamurella sp. YIM 132087]|uniref:LacI family DNA-binding transcriptional regulator n=1 Tax=Nakamurella alba TaxID=2665158 RepID=A0A7K1FQ30_9ACTN|nr:LacI family DNA-binding transcriptional regulator [Nakamurella alba]MTD14914.1 LacI family DNA-binding transcriptional regulator [Nakamurella alba]
MIAPSGRATVHDVARLSGVSIKTVSRVVNGAAEVTPATREKVLAAVAQLGYVRNPVAHSLRTGVSGTVGVIVDSISDSFFAALASGIEDRLLAAGFSVLIGSTGRDPVRERGQVDRMLQQKVAGLLLVPNASDHSYLPAAAGDLPVVLIDRSADVADFDQVGVRDRDGGHAATTHLLRHGHRRIAFLGGTTRLETVANRLVGYREALAEAGIEPDPRWIRTDCDEAPDARIAVPQLLALPDPPTAIFSSNQHASTGAVSVLHRTGRTDVALVSFGDFDLAATISPAVSVIHQNPRALAETAVDRLLQRISGAGGPAERIVLPVPLIERGSGELRPAG